MRDYSVYMRPQNLNPMPDVSRRPTSRSQPTVYNWMEAMRAKEPQKIWLQIRSDVNKKKRLEKGMKFFIIIKEWKKGPPYQTVGDGWTTENNREWGLKKI